MKKKFLPLAPLAILILSGNTYAALQVIGTAGYDGNGDGIEEAYNLIYMEI